MHSLDLAALAALLFACACGGSSITACGDDPDVSGAWVLTLAPSASDAGVAATIPSAVEVDAALEQGGKTDFLGLGHYVYGTLTAADPSYFGTLAIPRLAQNDGSKTGAVLGCALHVNVPIATPVSDDSVDQGPLRIALVGQIVAKGRIAGGEGSRLVLEGDPEARVRDFAWTAARR